MSKDDYYVIVYKILAYLYTQLKKGKDIELEYLMYDGILFNINRKYWAYIFYNLNKDGYIEGLNNITIGNGYYLKEQLENCTITPKGIDYLCNNTAFKKIVQIFKDVKEITPFI